ncbi:dihydrolipoyllysine-residue acetyltransferase [Marinobacter persicus]|uniref:Acetyltransferase component of pyruvate dehydrogenase complex n=1 Tax=Marinobacter persicus TaxID=930118 RepID=A0A2S6GAM7_9GAMM|nr:dihydrolipoyllysine-residue acetyltransferase [Marinobacter persicus]PPK53577.1 pyruvate dehydrogenase E2 component (dihydrolipoamide acetyltransferase) [Marinobacter persicus]PPK56391.1 pyruvate dehydrogenase E2 component (dihydrolipoamide acetyltransferase) [Marinobacter persicus]PPK59964.1 pyruvate dehydrogenase E2 component (dihydrolipoamide acetyltransferase) [Marinobacter persicus]
MSEQEIKVPDLGGADEVEIIEITVSEGDSVEEEDPILTIESDKASVELPSPAAGKITKITAKVGDKVKEGDVVGTIETSGDSGSSDESDAGDEEPEADKPKADKKETGEEEEKDDSEPKDREEDKEAGEEKSESKEAQSSSKKKGGSRKETVKVPNLDGFEDVPVIEINVAAGDTVGEEDPLVTVESDKATLEIPSPYAGKVEKVLVKEGDKLSEGDDLLEMTIEEEGGEEEESSEASETEEKAEEGKSDEKKDEKKASKESSGQEEKPSQQEGSDYEPPAAGTKVHAGPAVRKLAREFGADLTRIKGSGPKNRILKDDVQAYVKGQLQQTQQGGGGATAGAGIPGVKLPDFSQFGEVEREGMSRMMAATAVNMQRSWLNVPHVTQFDEADITEMESFRKAQKAAGEKKGVKMTPLPFLLKACAAALAELPQFNVSLDMERKEVVHKKYIHIGIAVDTPHGLMVPVLRDVDQKGLWELAAESAELAQKARDKQLKPQEMQGACFTITSLGGIGGTAFTPIVNTPEVAILGVSKAAMKPIWDGEDFQPRLMLPLSLSYDHRAVNGADAARFTNLLTQLLGDIRTLLL